MRLIGLAVVLTVSLILAPFAAEAQQAGKVARLGVLLFGTPATDPNLAAFVAGLRDLGYVEGRNLALEYRSAEGRPERVRELAVQVVSLKPDVIVVLGGDMVPFVKDATSTIPVVMLTSQDPVEAGVVTSFARPGANLTGVAFVSSETAGKRLQFLKEAVPSLTRVAVLWNPDHRDPEYRDIEAAARRLGVHIQSLEARRPEDFDGAFQSATRARADALMVVSSRFMNLSRSRILEFVSKQRIPLVTGWGPWVRAGGLLSYGPDLDALMKRAASHVDKILKGAKPADLPIEQPTKFELVINLKTAKALGLTIPQSVLGRADQVIE
ncbi:MAG: ABC transporter substrate-binding protein [Candidatus Rokuibacteriota bacterium]|nr:MAG: ABC transporter substrate-binding protein [Candidatus Rokubacteria bacterium]